MPEGIQISRQWVYVLSDGTPIVDWGDGQAQDLFSGDFFPLVPSKFSHGITNQELDQLVNAGRVATYDSQNVYILNLPDLPRKTID